MAGNDDWDRVKATLGWVINTHRDILNLSYKWKLDLLSLLVIHIIQIHISVNKMDQLIGKLRSIHLAVTGSIRHLYAMYVSLTST